MSNRIPATSPDYNAEGSGPITNLDLAFAVAVYSASGAIGIKEGTAVITDASAAAMTLAAPTAGTPASGGDDGRILTVLSTTAQAHTVTTPSNGINGVDHVATFSAAAGNFAEFVAYNGGWWLLSSKNITLS